MEKLLEKLKYDESTETLYLISENIEDDSDPNPEGITTKAKNKLAIPLKAKSTIEYIPKINSTEDRGHYQTISHRVS
jgi:hypothetical protein